MFFLYAESRAERTVFNHRNPDIFIDRLRLAIYCLFHNFPSRPLERFVFGEYGQTDSLSFFYEFLIGFLVEKGYYVAVVVKSEFINGILDSIDGVGSSRSFSFGGTGKADVVYCITVGGDGCFYKHIGFAVADSEELSCHRLSFRIVSSDIARFAFDGNLKLDYIGSFGAECVVKHDGGAFYPGVELRGHCIDAVAENACELFEGKKFVIPRELVCTRDGSSGEIVVELVPDEAAPAFGESLAGIIFHTEHFGCNGGSFGGVTKEFVLTVI